LACLSGGQLSAALHLTASMRVIKAHEGGRVTITWARRRCACREVHDKELLLAAKLERACRCSIDELAKIAETWEP